MVDQIIFLLVSVFMIGLHLFVRSTQANSSTICLYINNLSEIIKQLSIQNQNTRPTQSLPLLYELLVLMVPCLTISSIALPFIFVFGLHFSHPCRPSLAGYLLLPKCWNNCNFSHFPSSFTFRLASKVIIGILLAANYWCHAFACNIIPLVASGSLLLGTVSFYKLLKR